MTINAWGSDDPVEVAKGGTGRSSLTANSVLIGAGTSPINSVTLDDGETLIGSTGSDPVAATIAGTSDEIVVTAGAGSLSVGIADNPIFPGTGAVAVPSGTTAQRPGSPAEGMMRFNSTDSVFEGYQGSAWVPFTGTDTAAFDYLGRFTVAAGDLTIAAADIAGYTSLFALYEATATGTTLNFTIRIQGAISSTPVTSGYSGTKTVISTVSADAFSSPTAGLDLNMQRNGTTYNYGYVYFTNWNTANVTASMHSVVYVINSGEHRLMLSSTQQAITTPWDSIVIDTNNNLSITVTLYGIHTQ